MKLRNKKTWEIIDIKDALYASDDYPNHYTIEDDWEDYEEPIKKYCYVDSNDGKIYETRDMEWESDRHRKSIGNYFETKEEAEKAVEKLKAWKRLKGKGFKFVGWYGGNRIMHFRITSLDEEGDCLPHFVDDDTANDLDLLFGGEE